MKSVILFLTCLFLMFTFPALSQEVADSAAVKAEHSRVQASFETVVDKFVTFFQTDLWQFFFLSVPVKYFPLL